MTDVADAATVAKWEQNQQGEGLMGEGEGNFLSVWLSFYFFFNISKKQL